MENFYIGQNLGLNYAPEAAVWCNRNNAVLQKTNEGHWIISASVMDTADKAKDARDRRNALLSASDWTQLPNAPLSAEEKARWEQYRQHLRDIPKQSGFPTVIDWQKP